MESDGLRDKIILAPMVRGSELAFRSLIRTRGGIQTACFSPMVRAEEVVRAFSIWSESVSSQADMDVLQNISHEDGILFLRDIMADTEPLVVQLCGCSPEMLYQACHVLLQLNVPPHQCQIVGIDLNLGCPQHCARRGDFGAFLAEEQPDLAVQCVAAMRRAMDDVSTNQYSTTTHHHHHTKQQQPRLSCKIRLRDTVDDTIRFAKELQQAGCDMLTVHCRRREEKHEGLPDYAAGAAMVAALDIPVVINGNVWTLDDAREILTTTRAHAIMVARGFLRNPLMLIMSDSSNPTVQTTATTSPLYMAASYLDHAEEHPPPSPLYIRSHLRWIFRAELEPNHKYDRDYTDWKARLWTFLARPYLETIHQFRQVVALYARLKYTIKDNTTAANNNNNEPSVTMTLPLSLAHLPAASFHDIRHNVESQPLDEEDTAEEGGLALGLFD